MNKQPFAYIVSLTLLLLPVGGGVQMQSLPQPRSAVEVAQTPVQANPPENLADIPGASADWWSVVQENIRQSEYHVAWQQHTYLADLPAAYQAPNRAHNLRTYFTDQGIRVIPRLFAGAEPPWEWGLTLIGHGYAGTPSSDSEQAVRPVATANSSVQDNRIAYQRGDLTEWYVNDERGLEQGFTLHTPPRSTICNSLCEIFLDLALGGNLAPYLNANDSAIEFTGPDGARVLHYGQLAVHDASGRLLPAHLSLVSASYATRNTQHTIRIAFDATAAVYPITVDPLATSPSWVVEGDQGNARLGYDVSTAGDVNGDGYDDIIVGAPYYDDGGLTDRGEAFFYFGSPTGPSTSYDWVFAGAQSDELFGSAVGTAGDVNGDGYDELIVGAPFYTDGIQSQEGRVVVYYGTPSFPGTTWTVEGNGPNGHFGSSVSTAGDVNDDGYDDVIIGAPEYPNLHLNEGEAFVWYGSASGLNASWDWSATGTQAEAHLGWSVGTAGDVDGDGYDDVIVGAEGYSNGQTAEGGAFVWYGASSGLITPHGTPANADWSAEGGQGEAFLGYAVSGAGDVNGDGYDDVIVSAPGYDGTLSNEGRVYLHYGSSSGLNSTAGWTVYGGQESAYMGTAVSTAGDTDGDGYDDVLASAPYYDGGQDGEGRVYLYRGATTGLSATAAWSAGNGQTYAGHGISVSTAGDVNGDGCDDVLVGTGSYDGASGLDTGRAYLYYGSPHALHTAAHWSVEGDQAAAQMGFAVSTAGDVNGDGFSDVIVGAPGYDSGEDHAGKVLIFLGSATGLNPYQHREIVAKAAGTQLGYAVGMAGDVNGDGYADVIYGAPYYSEGTQIGLGAVFVNLGSADGIVVPSPWSLFGTQVGGNLGLAVGTAGDVNNDGYDDVIIGAPGYTRAYSREGRVRVYTGTIDGLSNTAAWTLDGLQTNAEMGYSVGTAGDVNGDGYADVIVGARNYASTYSQEGRVTVYHGKATGVEVIAAWTALGGHTEAYFGYSVATAGDVNGDGYSDVIAGAPGFGTLQVDEGRAGVWHGSANGVNNGVNGTLSSAPWKADGNQLGASLGVAVGPAGDVNGDGYADVVVGASTYDRDFVNEGRATVYHGGATGLSTNSAWAVYGGRSNARLGVAVNTAGDVDGDGFSDVIVGAPGYSNPSVSEGGAFVYRGAATGLSTDAGWSAQSANGEYDSYGWSVGTAGDVNSDGFSDVIVGAPGYDHGETDEGAAFLYYGASDGLETLVGWFGESDQESAFYGWSVGTAGDIDGDGYGDFVVGAPYYERNGLTDEGKVYFYHGTGSDPVLSGTAHGGQMYAYLGWSVGTAGDVNGDGYADVIAGLPGASLKRGRINVYYGSDEGASIRWDAYGTQDGARLGWSVGTAGDINGDGYSDVIAGAPEYDNGETDEGQVLLWLGSETGLETSYDPTWSAEGNQEDAYFGHAVGTAGDVNGDGYSDVIVGAYLYTNGEAYEGSAFAWYGSPTGLGAAGTPANADWSAEGEQVSAYLGYAVGTAGDVNGDGYADVVVGAGLYDGGEENEGRATVYHGSPAGLSTIADWVIEGNQAGACLGTAVGTAGDVNGDGYADVIIGARCYDTGVHDGGQARLYYGGGGPGRAYRPRQYMVAPLGMAASPSEVTLWLNKWMPLGRGRVRLEWQVAPLGTPFDAASGVISGTTVSWADTGDPGGMFIIPFIVDVEGLRGGTAYHWRVRLLYPPGNRLGQSTSRWVHVPWNGWNETDFRTPLDYVFLPLVCQHE